MRQLSNDEFKSLLSNNRNALIVGNGFSMNFDKDFGNLYFRLSEAHKDIKNLGYIEFSTGARPETIDMLQNGFEDVYEKFDGINQEGYEHFFDSAIEFAKLLKSNEDLKKIIAESRHLIRLSNVLDLYDVAVRLSEVGDEVGYYRVNIEDWNVLIWLYFIVKEEPIIQEFSKNNNFLRLVQAGTEGELFTNDPASIMIQYKLNGLTTYLRYVFLAAIFNKGKAIDITLLEKFKEIDFDVFKNLSNHFLKIFSLNYDHLVDDIFKTAVTHLHGDFSIKNKRCYYYSNLWFKYNKKRYSTSNIILGDFILSKILEPMMHKYVVSKHFNETKLLDTDGAIINAVKSKKLNSFVFFGVHPDNDFHIFKAIYDAFIKYPSKEMHITFCYYDLEELEAIKQVALKAIQSTGDQVLKVSMVNFAVVDSKEVISNYKEL